MTPNLLCLMLQAYICEFAPKPGRLDVDRCVEQGVVPGPMLGRLKAGEDVTLEDGRVIRSQDVVGQASPASSYLVIDLPELEYLDSLEESERLRNINNLNTVFHFTPLSVFTAPRYSEFLASLGEGVSHVMLNESCAGLGLPDVTSYTHKLRMIREEFFPVQRGAGDVTSHTELEKIIARPELGRNVMAASTGMKVNVRPTTEDRIDLRYHSMFLSFSFIIVFFSGVVCFYQELSTKEMLLGSKVMEEDREEYVKGMAEALEVARTYQTEEADGGETADKYPLVTFLGTGSSVPSKYRNVTGILVETQPGSFIIMDCGEGTLGQLVRLHGMEVRRVFNIS